MRSNDNIEQLRAEISLLLGLLAEAKDAEVSIDATGLYFVLLSWRRRLEG